MKTELIQTNSGGLM